MLEIFAAKERDQNDKVSEPARGFIDRGPSRL